MASKTLSLTPLTFHVLLALADANRHGYGIIKEIAARAGARAAPTTGALYLALQRMEGEGLVEGDAKGPADADARRRYYRLTAKGKEAARQETRRLSGLVSQARAKNLVG
ncbi:MAG: PadR family transcriptional regulator [Gemmatimonadetes bacterium]|nr:PadR family transcriptional regulator [Gemmatimonadota bacterium]